MTCCSLQNARLRKCSIVKEEDEDLSSGKEDKSINAILTSFNRRGSRSEGKLSHILQEKLTTTKTFGLKSVRNAQEDSLLEELSLSHGTKKNVAAIIVYYFSCDSGYLLRVLRNLEIEILIFIELE
ncbi:hypothetical protein TSAR_015090 [Trichomalopsis sarcophagae]|uniref:Uncharacterized protein n=1 Tax=Trichomalopsis sarcophagae TaxID=543379 RepID=A0A232F921_9HYME|nr:hypothetical protein TSAR_015090 [Trichomalopsis sarcophagae]